MFRIAPHLALGVLILLGSTLSLPAVVPSAALAQDGPAPELLERLERELDRTDLLLERLAPRIQESNHLRAQDLLNRATQLQAQARIKFQMVRDSDNLAMARRLAQEVLGLTLRAREFGQRAGQMMHEDVGLQERASRLIEQAQSIVDRVTDRLDGHEGDRARAILEESRRQLDAARRHYQDQQYEIAVRLAESALKLLDPLRGGFDDVRPDQLEAQLQRTQALLERAQERRGEFNEAEQRRLRQAQGFLERAYQAFRDRNPELSHRWMNQSRTILVRLLDQHGRTPGADDVARAFLRFDREAERVRELLDSGTPGEEARRLMERALDERDRAVEADGKGDHEGALSRLRAALDMLSRASRLLGAG